MNEGEGATSSPTHRCKESESPPYENENPRRRQRHQLMAPSEKFNHQKFKKLNSY